MSETTPLSAAFRAAGRGIDMYVIVARIAPAILASLPMVALGAAALTFLADVERLWSLAAVAVTTFAGLTSRKAGNRVQPELLAKWGGWPTTARLRWASANSPQEIARRHTAVIRVLGAGWQMPSREEEAECPTAADRVYEDAMQQIVGKVRHELPQSLVNAENRNYGFARNLLGLKTFGRWCACSALGLALVLGAIVARVDGAASASWLVMPIVVSICGLVLWPQVDADFVRPSADAYADHIIEVLDRLPPAPEAAA